MIRSFFIIVMLQFCGCSTSANRITRLETLSQEDAWSLVNGFEMPRVSGKPGSGAQALASIFSYYDRELEAEDVAEALPWHDLMANEVDLIGQGQMNGFEVVVSPGRWSMFETQVRRNDPVLVRIQPVDDGTSISLSSDEYGWVVIIGSSHDQRSIVLARERGKVLVVSREVFEPLWEAAGKRLLIFVPSYRR